MRLIDADELKKTIKNMPNDYYGDLCIGDALKEIDNAPTIYAAPVVRGEWQKKINPRWPAYLHEHCSICGWENAAKAAKYRTFPYCPNCGAKMEGERRTRNER
jgi:predicted RNA-binding Zn-ribbon protein involved in translation (DUF1610 family)